MGFIHPRQEICYSLVRCGNSWEKMYQMRWELLIQTMMRLSFNSVIKADMDYKSNEDGYRLLCGSVGELPCVVFPLFFVPPLFLPLLLVRTSRVRLRCFIPLQISFIREMTSRRTFVFTTPPSQCVTRMPACTRITSSKITATTNTYNKANCAFETYSNILEHVHAYVDAQFACSLHAMRYRVL
jgi:hypothetical protein